MKSYEYLSKKSQYLDERIDLSAGTKGWNTKSKEKAKDFPNFINATVGTARNNDGSLLIFPTLLEEFSKLSGEQIFAYSNIRGMPNFAQIWKEDTLASFPSELITKADKLSTLPLTSCGLTGGLSLAGKTFLDRDDQILVPNSRWGNVNHVLLKNHRLKEISYKLLNKEGKLNFSDLIEKIKILDKERKKFGIYLNFPNNPSGISPSMDQVKFLQETLLEITSPTIILLDDAYEGYVYESDALSHSLFPHLVGLNDKIIVVKVDGVSKRYCAYGARLGMVTLGFGQEVDDQQKTDVRETIAKIARTNTSSSPRGIQEALTNVLTDPIKKQKIAEERIIEREAKYREIINAMNDTACVIDFDGNFIDTNDAAVDVIGYSRDELLYMSVTDIDFNLNPEEIKARAKKMLTGEQQVFETIHTTKDGNTIPVEISSSFVTYAGKQAILSIARDISERKKSDEALDKLMKKLVTINEKLDAVGKLTRHDARNKLAGITNKIYLVKQQLAGDHNSLDHLDDIESAIDQIEQIFSFARTYEMVGAEELSYMDVKRFVDEAAILFSGMNRVKLVNECCGLTVLADLLLWQLFYNLIDNSLKHGENVTQIKVYYKEEDAQLKLIYEDNGVGIPDDEKEKVFMEHYGKGTGYGLYLIRKMCDAYGWTIKETGTPGKGAQFTMTLPGISKDEKTTYSIDN